MSLLDYFKLKHRSDRPTEELKVVPCIGCFMPVDIATRPMHTRYGTGRFCFKCEDLVYKSRCVKCEQVLK